MFEGLPEDTTYAELLEFLKRDLRLDATVDVLPGTISTALSSSWLPLSLGTGFANYGGTWQNAGYTLDGLGNVHVRGLVLHAGAYVFGITVATLPVGARPLLGEIFSCYGNDTSGGTNVIYRVDVSSNGAIQLTSSVPAAGGAGIAFLSLAGISFQQAK